MGAVIQVTAPLVIVRDEAGAQHYFYEGAILPAGLDGDHVKQLLDGELVSKVDQADGDTSDGGSGSGRVPTVKEILDSVGDDQEKAAEALAQEQARGDAARSTLVEKLEAIANPQGS